MSTERPFIRDMSRFPTTAARLAAWRAYPYREGKPLPDRWFGGEGGATPNEGKYHYGEGIGGDNDRARPFRFVGYADVIDRSIRHSGWYGDDEGSGFTMFRGTVFQIPGKDGAPRFMAGYEWGESGKGGTFNAGGGAIDYAGRGDVYDSKDEAARVADSIAENAAEREREYQAKQRAEDEEADAKREAEQAAQDEADAAEDARALESVLTLAGEVCNVCPHRDRLPPDVADAIDRLEDALHTYDARKGVTG